MLLGLLHLWHALRSGCHPPGSMGPMRGMPHSMHSMRGHSRSVHSMRSLNQAPLQASGAVAVVPLDPTAACAGWESCAHRGIS